MRFKAEHPDGYGAAISNIVWDFSWVGIAVALVLAGLLVVSHVRKLDGLYAATYYLGLWLLVVWFGIALIAMEVSFIGWLDPRGQHF